ncbi:thioredoxin-like protein [Polychytrium aggregatum]|uniref:thioredoxin-like protein n=1 Tax=Polychytrium aggregatum TaxID=110093 RepID=UPI0022FF32C2|nr:thioredoxin-like protein [Polychytrium aggregatum]KAI9202749.1 thioredoxin-like protein [Polychytrium aggregatum]
MVARTILYYSSVPSTLKLKKDQVRVQDILKARKVEFDMVDVSTEEDQKNYMRMKSGKNILPQIFVDGEYKGTTEDLEEANECENVVQWLGLDQEPLVI